MGCSGAIFIPGHESGSVSNSRQMERAQKLEMLSQASPGSPTPGDVLEVMLTGMAAEDRGLLAGQCFSFSCVWESPEGL